MGVGGTNDNPINRNLILDYTVFFESIMSDFP